MEVEGFVRHDGTARTGLNFVPQHRDVESDRGN
jgi:hypothetical protein